MSRFFIWVRNASTFFYFLLVGLLFVLWYFGSQVGYEWILINRSVTKTVEVSPFSLGTFAFSFEGKLSGITQLFSASIRDWPQWIYGIAFFLVWLSFTGLLALSTRAKAFVFYLAIFITIMSVAFLGLDVNVATIGQRTDTLILLVMLVVTAYYFQAFATRVIWWKVWLVLFALSSFPLFIWINQGNYGVFQLISGSYYLSVGIIFLFLFFFAEEPVFLILRLISSTRSSSNGIHFTILSLLYLGIILLFYLARAGFIESRWILFDPFLFFIGLLVVSFFTLPFKQKFASEILKVDVSVRVVFVIFLIGIIGNMAILTFLQNDSAYQLINYSTLYFLLGMGFLFLIYIVANFINPLAKGLPIYKIAYKERNMPYSTAKLGGMVIVLAFFFLSGGEIYKLMQGSQLAYESEHFRKKEPDYAKQLLEQSAYIAANNSFAQFRLGSIYESKSKHEEALGKYSLATKRYPTPYAYIKVAEFFSRKEDHLRAVNILREALYHFPNSLEIINNLSVSLIAIGSEAEAKELLVKANQKISFKKQPIRANLSLFTSEKSSLSPLEISNGLFKAERAYSNTKIDSQAVTLPLEIKGYSYVVNHLLYREDPILDTLANKVVNNLTNPTLEHNFNVNYAIYLYNRGEVYQSISRLEAFALNTTDPWLRSAYILTLAKIQLKERAYRSVQTTLESLDPLYFPEKLYILLAAYLENQQINEAKNLVDQWEILAIYRPFLQEITSVNTADFTSLYYNCLSFTADEMSSFLKQFSQEEAQKIEEKYMVDHLNAGRRELVMDFIKRKTDHQFVNQFKASEESEVPDFRNPFAPWKFIYALEANDSTSIQEYNKLTEMMYRNPENVLLLQGYCLEALEQGLVNYAENALVALYFLMPDGERFVFERKYQDKYDLRKQKSFSTVF